MLKDGFDNRAQVGLSDKGRMVEDRKVGSGDGAVGQGRGGKGDFVEALLFNRQLIEGEFPKAVLEFKLKGLWCKSYRARQQGVVCVGANRSEGCAFQLQALV